MAAAVAPAAATAHVPTSLPTDVDVCARRFTTASERSTPAFRAAMATSPCFRQALTHLPHAHVARVLEQSDRSQGLSHRSQSLSERDVCALRVHLVVARWTHAICQTCCHVTRKPLTARTTVRPCGACFLVFYCSDACEARHAAAHKQQCCNVHAPLDVDDPLLPAVVRDSTPSPAADAP